MPRHKVWILTAPNGDPSRGPEVAYDLNAWQDLIDAGWLVTGPYVLDPAAALQAMREYQEFLDYREKLRQKEN